ncbi:MAG: DNA-processing protein DprA [Candidatus Cryptobacteroides sp.]
MSGYDENICMCVLNRIFGDRPKVARGLVERLGSAEEVFRAGEERLREALPYRAEVSRICDREYERSEAELKSLEAHGTRFINCRSPIFPAFLKECPDCPSGLYVRGDWPATAQDSGVTGIAVVGTRDLSDYGREWCRRIILRLSETEERPMIVSGLAIGTDITAHRSALEFGLPTVAVLPTGPDRIYPACHSRDAQILSERKGCAIVTDFPPGTPAIKYNFLRRNRIIAGMCPSVILTESRIRGGGMTTARAAFSYDRNVFVLPGRADDSRSQGCNYLIREKIAEPIISGDTVAAVLGLTPLGHRDGSDGGNWSRDALKDRYGRSLGAEDIGTMAEIILAVKRERGITLDGLSERLGTGIAKTASLARILQCDGIIDIDLMDRCSIRINKIP